MILDLLAPFLPHILAALAVVGALFGFGKAKQRQGRKEAEAKRATQDAAARQRTVKEVLNETVSADPADAVRRRMRDRAGKP